MAEPCSDTPGNCAATARKFNESDIFPETVLQQPEHSEKNVKSSKDDVE